MTDLRRELQTIYETHGRLTPELIVAEARPEDHPLHNQVFDRNAPAAAEAWYREKAHELIQRARVVYRGGDRRERSVRAFHAVRSEGGGGEFVYEPADRVARDPITRALVLRAMEREWGRLFDRYKEFEEFLDMIDADLMATRQPKVK